MFEWLNNFLSDNGALMDLIRGAAEGGIAAYGFDKLIDRTQTQRDEMMDPESGLFKNLNDTVTDTAGFKGFGVIDPSGGTGGYSVDPVTGESKLNMTLGENEQARADMLRGYSNTMYGNSMDMNSQLSGQATSNFSAADDFRARSQMDTGAREADIYERIRAMQRPGEERQAESMNAGLFGSGRGGMQTAAFGGSPEQFAFGKAQAEARNAASYQAINQAQQEMMNYGNMSNMYGQQGTGQLSTGANMQNIYNNMAGNMLQGSYMPQDKLMEVMGMGMQGSGMENSANQNLAGLLSQIGIGQATTDVNYSNIEAEAFTGLLKAIGSAVGGIGGGVQQPS